MKTRAEKREKKQKNTKKMIVENRSIFTLDKIKKDRIISEIIAKAKKRNAKRD